MTALGAKEIMIGPGEAVLPVVLLSLCLGGATYVVGCAVIAWRAERVVWTSAWVVGAVLALLAFGAVPWWVNGAEEVPWAPIPGVPALLLVALALAVVLAVTPLRWRSAPAR